MELRDKVSLQEATVRELQDWSVWNGSIAVTLNTGGLPPGRHGMHLVVIDGVDANGWDRVVGSQAVTVLV